MYREQLLEILKPRVSDYYYTILVVWTAKRDKTLWFKNKFSLKPTDIGYGYWVELNFLDTLLIWDK